MLLMSGLHLNYENTESIQSLIVLMSDVLYVTLKQGTISFEVITGGEGGGDIFGVVGGVPMTFWVS